jgi:hypothetical protein
MVRAVPWELVLQRVSSPQSLALWFGYASTGRNFPPQLTMCPKKTGTPQQHKTNNRANVVWWQRFFCIPLLCHM